MRIKTIHNIILLIQAIKCPFWFNSPFKTLQLQYNIYHRYNFDLNTRCGLVNRNNIPKDVS